MKSRWSLASLALALAALASCTDAENMTCNDVGQEVAASSNGMILSFSKISTLQAADESILECRGIATTGFGRDLAFRFRRYQDGDGDYVVESEPDLPFLDHLPNSFPEPELSSAQPIEEDANIDMYDNGDGRSIVEQGGRPCIGRWFHSYEGGRIAITLRDDGTASIEPTDEPAVEGTFRLAGDGAIIAISEPSSSYDGTSQLDNCAEQYTTLRVGSYELSLAKW